MSIVDGIELDKLLDERAKLKKITAVVNGGVMRDSDLEVVNARIAVEDVVEGMYILRPNPETVDSVYKVGADHNGIWLTFMDGDGLAVCYRPGTYLTQIMVVLS